jgi:hypothetical protein
LPRARASNGRGAPSLVALLTTLVLLFGFQGEQLAGACFSLDGQTLFVNIFGDGSRGSGMICAISGPWERGPL